MQVLNSAMHMQTVNTTEALFEQAGDEATDSSSLPDQHLWSEKGLACKTICIDVCTLNPPHSSTYNFLAPNTVLIVLHKYPTFMFGPTTLSIRVCGGMW